MSNTVTVVRDPATHLGKVFAADGSKSAQVQISRAVAVQYDVPTAQAMADLLSSVQHDPHAALILAEFPGIPLGVEFDLLSERELQALTGRQDVRSTAFLTQQGRYITGRFIERVRASNWLLLDRDTDGQTPAHLAPEALPADAWLTYMGALLPGIAHAPMVHVPSSSARIRRADGSTCGAGNGHWYVQVADGGDVERLKVTAEANAIRAGLAWQWRNSGGACSLRTLCDLSVWTPGRLIFDGAPVAAPGMQVLPPAISVRNAAGTPLNTAAIQAPSREEFRELTRMAGAEKVIRGDGRAGIDAYDLPQAMLIETEDYGTLPLSTLVDLMICSGIDKVRCQTPFRESVSMAGVVRLGADGKPALYDVGTGTTHWLAHGDYAATVFDASPALPPGCSATPVGKQERQAPPTAATLPPGSNRLLAATRNLAQPDAKAAQRKSIIYGMIADASINVMWGKPGSGKSFIAANLARAVATGTPFHKAPTRQSKVLYISTEGDVRKRFAADGLAGLGNIDTLEEPINLAEPFDVVQLEALITAGGYSLVIYDVFAECFIGDENSTPDMLAAMRGIRQIRDTTGAAQLIVHHSNKSGDAIRGSSVIIGAADNELQVLRLDDSERRQLKVGKCRDGRDYRDVSHFDLESVDMGEDTDPIAPAGSRITAARVKWIAGAEVVAERMEAKQTRPALTEGGPEVVDCGGKIIKALRGIDIGKDEASLRNEIVVQLTAPERKASAEFTRSLDWLCKSGYLRSEVTHGGKVFKLAHRDEIDAADEFGRFCAETLGTGRLISSGLQ